MGMYDSIYLEIKCPYCGETSEVECQTKELGCTLHKFSKGDSIGTNQYNYLECISDCHSKQCTDNEEKRIGYRSGFGTTFDVKVKISNGIITGDYEITYPSNPA